MNVETPDTFTGQDILTIKCATQALVPIYTDLLVATQGKRGNRAVFTFLPVGKGYGAELMCVYTDGYIRVTAYYATISATDKHIRFDRPITVLTKEQQMVGVK